jgi:beta-glucosidase
MSFNTTINNDIENKIKALLEEMTVREKIGQTIMLEPCFLFDKLQSEHQFESMTDPRFLDIMYSQYNIGSLLYGGVSRIGNDSAFDWATYIKTSNDYTKQTKLKIPMLYGADAVHGVNFVKGSTIYSHNLGVTSTWNDELVFQYGEIVGKEMNSIGVNLNFAPTIDVARDQRWGRVYESVGEDAYLASRISEALVSGMQNENQISACAKHFVGYGESSNGMDRTPADISERNIREHHIPPFEAAIKAGVHSIMVNGGDVNGTPMPMSKRFMTDVLRGELGFRGITLSDWEDVYRLIDRHRVARDKKDAIKKAFNAGLDVSMAVADLDAVDIMEELVNDGEITIERLDQAVSNILRVKFELGLFDQSDLDVDFAVSLNGNKESKRIASEITSESITLLKNENDLLPLSKDLKSILVTGKSADSKRHLCGGWTLSWASADENDLDCFTILDAIKRTVSKDTKITYVYDLEELKQLNPTPSQYDVIISVVGEEPHSEWLGDSFDLQIEDDEFALLKSAKNTDIPVVMVSMVGRPQKLIWMDQNIPAILQTYYPGTEGAIPVAQTIFGDICPSGKTAISFPKDGNQIPIVYNARRYQSGDVFTKYDPLYPFGYGLSYTTFEYSDLFTPSQVERGQGLHFEVSVKNTGAVEGKEVVQVYLEDLYASVTRPLKSLKAYQKISLLPGEKKTIHFYLDTNQLSLYNENFELIEEARKIKLMVGNQSKEFEII